MRHKTNIFCYNPFIEKLSLLSGKVKVLILLGCFIPAALCIALLLAPNLLPQIQFLRIVVSFLCFFIGYLFWGTLISCLTSQKARGVLGNIMLLYIPLVLLGTSLQTSNQEVLSPVHLTLLQRVPAPSGRETAEAYLLEENPDGTFSAIVYITSTTSIKLGGSSTTRNPFFRGENLKGLTLEWKTDQILLINGEEYDLVKDAPGWHYP